VAASTVSERYATTPEEAWRHIGDFDGIATLFAGIEEATSDGSVRTFSMMGMRISEKLVRRDDATRTIVYAIVDGVPIESAEVTISVKPADEGCEVFWSVVADPEEAQPLFTDTYERALQHLHSVFDPS
jgi:carbon monoxide dehydrogenase subunit G